MWPEIYEGMFEIIFVQQLRELRSDRPVTEVGVSDELNWTVEKIRNICKNLGESPP